MRTEFITLFVIGHVLSERLLALLAHKRHFGRLAQVMRLVFGVTFCAIVPLLAARSSYGDLGV